MRRVCWVQAALFGAILPAYGQGGAPNADVVFRTAAKSVVSVHVFEPRRAPQAQRRKRVSFGSGVAIAPARVVTNCHVLAAGIVGDGRTLTAEVKEAGQRARRAARLVGADPARDLCVLDAPGLGVSVGTLGTTRTLRVGQGVFAVVLLADIDCAGGR